MLQFPKILQSMANKLLLADGCFTLDIYIYICIYMYRSYNNNKNNNAGTKIISVIVY